MITKQILKDMEYFGLYKSDIDNEGYVTLYHGTVNLPNKIKKNEIFFLTSSKEVAQDYADMRSLHSGKRGKVIELKVKPEDVHWNTGTQEVEFTKGGIIKDNKIISYKKRSPSKIDKNSITYKNFKVGDLIKTDNNIFKVLQIYKLDNGKVQFLLYNKRDKKEGWYNADTIISWYEYYLKTNK